MLDRYWPNAWANDIYGNYSHRPRKVYFIHTSHFLVSLRYYSTSGGSTRFSFSGNLNYYYNEFHGIGNSFHDHVHEFEMISHSLQAYSWMGLVISHHKLIVLLSHKKT